jgi:hypothetical protein
MCPHNVFEAAGFDVIPADHLLDLACRTRTVINQYDLAFALLPHGRLVLQHRG